MKFQDIIFIILFIISMIVALWYLFGSSPAFEQALLILIITFLFKIHSNVITNSTELKILKNSFIKLAQDFKEHIKHK